MVLLIVWRKEDEERKGGIRLETNCIYICLLDNMAPLQPMSSIMPCDLNFCNSLNGDLRHFPMHVQTRLAVRIK